MKTVLRWIGYVIGAVGALALVVLGILLYVNRHDEALLPEAEQTLKLPAPKYAAEDNIYVALLGLNAPAGESIIQAGKRRIDKYNDLIKKIADKPFVDVHEDDYSGRELEVVGDLGKLDLSSESVWALSKDKMQDISNSVVLNAELLSRYKSIFGLPHYQEVAAPSLSVFTAYADPELRKLFLFSIAATMRAENDREAQQAVGMLLSDMEMWKVVLAGEGGFIAKLVAAASLHADMLLMGDMLADPDARLSTMEAAGVGQRLFPAPIELWKAGSAYPVEFRFMASTLDYVKIQAEARQDEPPNELWSRWVTKPLSEKLLQRNATINAFFGMMDRMRLVAGVDPKSFEVESKKLDTWVTENTSVDSIWRKNPGYNPMGRILVSVVSPQPYLSYSQRLYDVAALQKLIYQIYQIRSQHVSSSELEYFLKENGPEAEHPVSGKKFYWDKDAKTLSVITMAEMSAKRRFSFDLHSIVQ